MAITKKDEQPDPGYLSHDQVEMGIQALKDYIIKSKALKLSCAQKKNLLEAGNKDQHNLNKVVVEVVFKNIPTNSRTYIHNIVLPNHWRLKLDPEHHDMAIFVKHRRPETEAQKIQFSKDRDLDIENTHAYYQHLFLEKLDEAIRARISRIITTKELATEFNTFQKLDRLSKTYDLFIADKQLMSNKMNSLPRRLGRRFWVREKKVPIMVNLNGKNLNERLTKAMSIEPFYVLGRSTTEQIQIGLIGQPEQDLIQNMKAFLDKLYDLYADNIRFIRVKTNWGVALPLYADLSTSCPNVIRRRKKNKMEPVIDDFDMLEGDAKVSVHPDGTVKVLKGKRKRTDVLNSTLDDSVKKMKKVKRIKGSPN